MYIYIHTYIYTYIHAYIHSTHTHRHYAQHIVKAIHSIMLGVHADKRTGVHLPTDNAYVCVHM